MSLDENEGQFMMNREMIPFVWKLADITGESPQTRALKTSLEIEIFTDIKMAENRHEPHNMSSPNFD